MSVASVAFGLAVPSLKPSRLRGVAVRAGRSRAAARSLLEAVDQPADDERAARPGSIR